MGVNSLETSSCELIVTKLIAIIQKECIEYLLCFEYFYAMLQRFSKYEILGEAVEKKKTVNYRIPKFKIA